MFAGATVCFEVKCLFTFRDKGFLDAAIEYRFFLQEHNGKPLKQDHAYFFQIPMQMKVCGTLYGNFIVWREEELVVERLNYDDNFVTEALEKANNLYVVFF